MSFVSFFLMCVVCVVTFCSSLLTYLFVLQCFKDYNTVLTAVLDIFTYYICLICSHIVLNLMEFYATVIQVRGLPIATEPGFFFSIFKIQPKFNMTG